MKNESQLDDFINMIESAGIRYFKQKTMIGYNIELKDVNFYFDDAGNLERYDVWK